jgi:methylated-DNA-protein-cysteine methyltransferase-like protein
MSNFYEEIYDLVRLIPKGRVSSYGLIAKALGREGAARQVGYALNRCPVDVPAHRVLNRNGVLTAKNHFGGNKMQELLELEGIPVKNDQVQNYEQYLWDPNLEI